MLSVHTICRHRSSVNFRWETFRPDNTSSLYVWKINKIREIYMIARKCQNFTWHLPEKYSQKVEVWGNVPARGGDRGGTCTHWLIHCQNVTEGRTDRHLDRSGSGSAYSWARARGAQLAAGYTVNTYSKPPMYDASKCGNVTRRS